MKFVYFAWVRERIGLGEETRDLPDSVRTVGDVLDWLAGQGEEYAHALSHRSAIRVALDKEHAGHDEPVGNAGEIALFPPMTGG